MKEDTRQILLKNELLTLTEITKWWYVAYGSYYSIHHAYGPYYGLHHITLERQVMGSQGTIAWTLQVELSFNPLDSVQWTQIFFSANSRAEFQKVFANFCRQIGGGRHDLIALMPVNEWLCSISGFRSQQHVFLEVFQEVVSCLPKIPTFDDAAEKLKNRAVQIFDEYYYDLVSHPVFTNTMTLAGFDNGKECAITLGEGWGKWCKSYTVTFPINTSDPLVCAVENENASQLLALLRNGTNLLSRDSGMSAISYFINRLLRGKNDSWCGYRRTCDHELANDFIEQVMKYLLEYNREDLTTEFVQLINAYCVELACLNIQRGNNQEKLFLNLIYLFFCHLAANGSKPIVHLEENYSDPSLKRVIDEGNQYLDLCQRPVRQVYLREVIPLFPLVDQSARFLLHYEGRNSITMETTVANERTLTDKLGDKQIDAMVETMKIAFPNWRKKFTAEKLRQNLLEKMDSSLGGRVEVDIVKTDKTVGFNLVEVVDIPLDPKITFVFVKLAAAVVNYPRLMSMLSFYRKCILQKQNPQGEIPIFFTALSTGPLEQIRKWIYFPKNHLNPNTQKPVVDPSILQLLNGSSDVVTNKKGDIFVKSDLAEAAAYESPRKLDRPTSQFWAERRVPGCGMLVVLPENTPVEEVPGMNLLVNAHRPLMAKL